MSTEAVIGAVKVLLQGMACRKRLYLIMVLSFQEQRVPKLPNPTVLSKRNDQVKGRQKKNFDVEHGVKMLPTLHPGDTVWILDCCTMGRVVKETTP